MVSQFGLLSAAVFVFAPHRARGNSGAGCRQTSSLGLLAVVPANFIRRPPSVLALAALRKLSRPPSSPGNAAGLLLRLTWKGEPHRGRGSGTAQTAPSAVGIFAAAQLDGPPGRHSARVCWAMSLASGKPPQTLSRSHGKRP